MLELLLEGLGASLAWAPLLAIVGGIVLGIDRKSTRLNSSHV